MKALSSLTKALSTLQNELQKALSYLTKALRKICSICPHTELFFVDLVEQKDFNDDKKEW